MYKFTQRSWVGGRLDAELMGRQDLTKYFQGASELKNFVVRRQGNLSKRKGTDLVCDLKHLLGYNVVGGVNVDNEIGKCRVFPIVNEKTEGYYFLITGGRAFLVSKDGILMRNGEWTKNVINYEFTDYLNDSYVNNYAVSSADAQTAATTFGWFVTSTADGLSFSLTSGGTSFATWTTPTSGTVANIVCEGGYVINTANGNKMATSVGRVELIATYDSTEKTWTALENPQIVLDDNRPKFINIGYDDESLYEINICQSGDTVFLVHRNFCPKKIVRGEFLTCTDIQFSNRAWNKPRIVNIVSSGTFGSGSLKTIYYVCTYVKDGIESEPSVPFAFAYKVPWSNTGILTITCDKGANAEDPDYYNIYKKNTSDYGLIATMGGEATVIADAQITKADGVTPVINNPCFITNAGAWSDYMPTSAVLNRDAGVICLGTTYSGITNRQKLCGGLESDTGIKVDFGAGSGEIISKLTIGLNSYVGTNKQVVGTTTASSAIYFSGKAIRVTAHTEEYNASGVVTASHDFVKVVKRKSSFDNINYRIGKENYTSMYGTTARASYYLDGGKKWYLGYEYVRTEYNNYFGQDAVDADFGADFDQYYGTKTSDASTRARRYQVRYFLIETFEDTDQNDNPINPTTCFIHSLQFSTIYSKNNTFNDDYVEPDLTVTPPSTSTHFDTQGDYPACVGLYQQRLCFASTKNDPFTFWMSCVGDLYNFDTHSSIREDDAISATLAATEFPRINHMVMNRDLMVFADSGEWKIAPVSGNTLTYKTVSSVLQSAIGCSSTVSPVNVGDEIVFVKSTGETLLATRYNFTSDGYESQDLSVMSQWIFKNNPIVQMAYRQHPDSTIECVLQDGTIASLVYMKEHEVCAWSRQILGGNWKAIGIATSKAISNGSTEVILLVKRNNDYALWKFRDDIPVRGTVNALDEICMDGLHEVLTGEIVAQDMTTVQVNGVHYAGYVFDAELVTVRPEPQGNETIQFEFKNAKFVEMRVLDSGNFTVRGKTVDDSYSQTVETGASIAADGTMNLASRDFTAQLFGDNTGDGRIVIKSATPYPLNILSLSVNYEIHPLSGSAG